METRRWINQSQPQTLVIATFLLYFTAVFTLLFFAERIFYYVTLCTISPLCSIVPLMRLVIPALAVAAAWGIANERGWSWRLGLVAGGIPLAVRLIAAFRLQVSPLDDFLGLLFDVALVALLLHPQSREYQRIWFTGGGQRRRR